MSIKPVLSALGVVCLPFAAAVAADAVPAGHMGLGTMRQRAEALIAVAPRPNRLGGREVTVLVDGIERELCEFRGLRLAAAPDLPTADEIAAELERYLATRPAGDDDKG